MQYMMRPGKIIFALILGVWLIFTGSVAAEERFPVIFEATKKAVLSAELAGVLKKMNYGVGSTIKKGSVIAEVDTGDLALRKKRSVMSLKHLSGKAENLGRLINKGLATNEELAQAVMERDVIKTDIEILKRQISKARIRAPFNCALTRRNAQAHEWVTVGQPVVDVVNTSGLRAVGNIPSALSVTLKKGDTHSFYVSDLDVTVMGTVTAVAPEVDELSNTTQVLWQIKKESHPMISGMKGEVTIER